MIRQLTVVVSGRQALTREAIAAALAAEDGILVVAVCRDSHETLLQVERLAPDVALVEANLPRSECRRICSGVKDRGLSTKVLVSGELPDEQVLMTAVEAGADGYVAGDLGLAGLADALRRVAAGEAIIPAMMLGPLLGRLVDRRRERHAVAQRFSGLSPRERQVLSLMMEGADRHRIAEKLVISPETARTHIQNVISKIGARSRVEAIALSVEHGLLDGIAVGASNGHRTPGDRRHEIARN